MLLNEIFNKPVKYTMHGRHNATFDIDHLTYRVHCVPSFPKSKQGIAFMAEKTGLNTTVPDIEDSSEHLKIKSQMKQKYPTLIIGFDISKGLTDDQIEKQNIRAVDNNLETDEDSHDSNYELSDSGNQFAVFSTIFEIMKEIVDTQEASGGMVIEFSFSGKGMSRNSLYGRMVNKYASKLGFTSNTKGLSKYVTHDQEFLIINKKIA